MEGLGGFGWEKVKDLRDKGFRIPQYLHEYGYSITKLMRWDQ